MSEAYNEGIQAAAKSWPAESNPYSLTALSGDSVSLQSYWDWNAGWRDQQFPILVQAESRESA